MVTRRYTKGFVNKIERKLRQNPNSKYWREQARQANIQRGGGTVKLPPKKEPRTIDRRGSKSRAARVEDPQTGEARRVRLSDIPPDVSRRLTYGETIRYGRSAQVPERGTRRIGVTTTVTVLPSAPESTRVAAEIARRKGELPPLTLRGLKVERRDVSVGEALKSDKTAPQKLFTQLSREQQLLQVIYQPRPSRKVYVSREKPPKDSLFLQILTKFRRQKLAVDTAPRITQEMIDIGYAPAQRPNLKVRGLKIKQRVARIVSRGRFASFNEMKDYASAVTRRTQFLNFLKRQEAKLDPAREKVTKSFIDTISRQSRSRKEILAEVIKTYSDKKKPSISYDVTDNLGRGHGFDKLSALNKFYGEISKPDLFPGAGKTFVLSTAGVGTTLFRTTVEKPIQTMAEIFALGIGSKMVETLVAKTFKGISSRMAARIGSTTVIGGVVGVDVATQETTPQKISTAIGNIGALTIGGAALGTMFKERTRTKTVEPDLIFEPFDPLKGPKKARPQDKPLTFEQRYDYDPEAVLVLPKTKRPSGKRRGFEPMMKDLPRTKPLTFEQRYGTRKEITREVFEALSPPKLTGTQIRRRITPEGFETQIVTFDKPAGGRVTARVTVKKVDPKEIRRYARGKSQGIEVLFATLRQIQRQRARRRSAAPRRETVMRMQDAPRTQMTRIIEGILSEEGKVTGRSDVVLGILRKRSRRVRVTSAVMGSAFDSFFKFPVEKKPWKDLPKKVIIDMDAPKLRKSGDLTREFLGTKGTTLVSAGEQVLLQRTKPKPGQKQRHKQLLDEFQELQVMKPTVKTQQRQKQRQRQTQELLQVMKPTVKTQQRQTGLLVMVYNQQEEQRQKQRHKQLLDEFQELEVEQELVQKQRQRQTQEILQEQKVRQQFGQQIGQSVFQGQQVGWRQGQGIMDVVLEGVPRKTLTLGWPKPKDGKKKRVLGELGAFQPKGRTPSLFAVTFGVFGKRSLFGEKTGLGLRPILRGKI